MYYMLNNAPDAEVKKYMRQNITSQRGFSQAEETSIHTIKINKM